MPVCLLPTVAENCFMPNSEFLSMRNFATVKSFLSCFLETVAKYSVQFCQRFHASVRILASCSMLIQFKPQPLPIESNKDQPEPIPYDKLAFETFKGI